MFSTIRKTNGGVEGGTWYRKCRTNEEQQVRVQVFKKTDQAAETCLRPDRLVIGGGENLCWCAHMVSRKTTRGNHRLSIPVITALCGFDTIAITTWLFPDETSLVGEEF